MKRVIPLLVLSAVAVLCADLLAQEIAPDCPEIPEDEAAAKKLAGKWFKKASSLFGEKQYNWALGAYLCSIEIVEHPVTLFNAAQAARYAGHGKKAIDLAKRSLAKDSYGQSADEARKLIEKIEKQIGKAPSTEPEMEPEPDEPEEATPPEPELKPEPDEPEKVDLAIPAYIGLGVGGAGLIMGAVLQGLAGKASGDTEETSTYSAFMEKENDMNSFQTGAITGFVFGGAVVVAGLVMLGLNEKGESEESKVSVTPAPGGLIVGGTF